MPNHVVIDARKLGDGGIGVYLENLIDGLVGLELNAKVSLIVVPSFNKTELKVQWQDKVELVQDSASKYSFAEYFLMPLRLRRFFKNSLIHFPHYTVPFFIPKSAKVVVTVHDCIHISSKIFLKKIFSRLMIFWATKRADRVITVSNYSKAEILKNFSVDEDKIKVIANCVSPGLKVKVNKNNPNYFLFVGSGREHKGLDLLLPICSRFNQKLLIVGDFYTEAQKALASDTIVFVGKCSADQLSSLYSGATALIMPSRKEGFGIPVLEALTLGLPVVATPVPSFIEWFGDTVWYADCFDSESLSTAIMKMLANSELRQEKINAGLALSTQFTLESSAKSTFDVYKKLKPELQTSDNKVFFKVA